MREIKFRSWNKITNIMEYNVESRSDDKHGRSYPYNFNDYLTDEDYELMQYTGVKDSKGVEIYEGDIVEKIGWEGEYYKIVFEDYGFKLYNLADCPMMFTSRYEEMFSANGFTVVGNTHESIERLEITGNLWVK